MAVDPPLVMREELAEWARRVAADARASASPRGGLRLLDAASLHLTLCFLGSRPVGAIDALATALAACDEHAVELSVGAPLWLPPRGPHALAVEVHDHAGELARVQERVAGALSSVSAWRPERRRFRAHITLARVRRGFSGAGRRGLSADRPRSDRAVSELALPATPRLGFAPEAIVLYRSWLTRDGATYEALAECALAMAGR